MHRRFSKATAMVGAFAITLLSIVAIGTEPASAASGQLTGTVRDTLTNNPLAGIEVRAYGGAYGALYGMTTTAANGQYSLTLPGSSFKLRFDEPSAVHQRTYSGGATTLAAATKVTVPANQTTAYDITMKTVAKSGRITGSVTDTFHRDPVPGAQVRAYGGAYGSLYGSTTVDSAGTWNLILPAGSFKIRYDDPSGTRPRIYSGGGATLATATPISVTAYATSTTKITMTGPVGADCPAVIPTEYPDPEFPPPDWSGYQLAGCDLHGAQLSGYDLNGADLAGANLQNAQLPLANLANADLRNANLTNAVLFYWFDEWGEISEFPANMGGARIAGAKFLNADASPFMLLETNPDWTDADMRAVLPEIIGGENSGDLPVFALLFIEPYTPNSTSPPLTLNGARFDHAALDGFAGFTFAGLTCNLCEFGQGGDPLNQSFNAQMAGASLTDFTCTGCGFRQANFTGARVSGNLTGSILTGANLSNADFSGVTGNPAGGSTATYSATKCPDGVTTNGTTVTTCVGHGLAA